MAESSSSRQPRLQSLRPRSCFHASLSLPETTCLLFSISSVSNPDVSSQARDEAPSPMLPKAFRYTVMSQHQSHQIISLGVHV